MSALDEIIKKADDIYGIDPATINNAVVELAYLRLALREAGKILWEVVEFHRYPKAEWWMYMWGEIWGEIK